MNISGFLFTIDAIGCQNKIVQKIVDKSADYLLAVKGIQGALERVINDFYKSSVLNKLEDGDGYSTKENSHGRIETRCTLLTTNRVFLGDIEYEWPGLKSVGIMVNMRQENGRTDQSDL